MLVKEALLNSLKVIHRFVHTLCTRLWGGFPMLPTGCPRRSSLFFGGAPVRLYRHRWAPIAASHVGRRSGCRCSVMESVT